MKKGKLLLQTSLYLKETLSKNEKFTALSLTSPLFMEGRFGNKISILALTYPHA